MIPAPTAIYTDPKFLEGFSCVYDPNDTEGIENRSEREWIWRAARDCADPVFVFAEIGAGYGRWSVYAATVVHALIPGKHTHVIAVEPDPDHFQWLREHLRENGVTHHTLFKCPVTGTPEIRWFHQGNPARWYGQGIVLGWGRTVWLIVHGEHVLPRKTCTLERVFRDFDRVHLADIDIQGFELDVLRNTPEKTLDKVHRLYLGTHSPEIEAGLRELLGGMGWTCEEDVPQGTGGITDGIQVWRNPKMEEQDHV